MDLISRLKAKYENLPGRKSLTRNQHNPERLDELERLRQKEKEAGEQLLQQVTTTLGEKPPSRQSVIDAQKARDVQESLNNGGMSLLKDISGVLRNSDNQYAMQAASKIQRMIDKRHKKGTS